MRSAAAFFLLAFAPLGAQVADPSAAKPAAPTSPAAALPCIIGPKISPQTFTNLESRFDSTLNALNDKDQVDLLGATRALYLRDYGLTLSAEVSLVKTPTINPFRRSISPADKEAIHQRKLAQLPLLKKAMRDMVRASALTLAGAVGLSGLDSSGLQVVLSVKVLYLDWEDMTGLPGQITLKADLKSAIAGELQEEVQ